MSNLLSRWVKSRVGTGYKIDLDNGSYDCVDVPKDYAQFIYGKPFAEVYGRGNAKDHWKNVNGNYWSRSQTPRIGSVVCMDGSIGGGYGHVAVVIGIDGGNITVAQQNTFKQSPIYTGVYSAKASYIQGYLYPSKVDIGDAKAVTEPYQRIVDPAGAKYRRAPNVNGEVIEIFKGGDTANFKGWVNGQAVDGNSVWFVGRFTGGYSWSGGYTNSGVEGLVDLNPKEVPISATQRQVDSDVMNARVSAQVEAGSVLRTFNPSTIIDMKGYVHGQNIDGVDVWFLTTDNLYIWAGGFTNKTTAGLKDLTPATPVVPQSNFKAVDPQIEDLTAVDFPAWIDYAEGDDADDTDLINRELYDYYLNKYQQDREYYPVEMHAHWWGAPEAGYTFDGVVNGFNAKNSKSVDFVIGEHQVHNFKSLKKAPMTTGARNMFAWTTENDPRLTDGVYNTLGFVTYAVEKKNPRLKDEPIRLHKEFMPTDCSGVDVARVRKIANEFAEGKLDPETGIAPVQVDKQTEADSSSAPEQADIKPEVENSEAVASATKFVARIGTQVAASKIVVSGIMGMLAEQGVKPISSNLEGGLVVFVAVVLIFISQYGYKLKTRFKWLF